MSVGAVNILTLMRHSDTLIYFITSTGLHFSTFRPSFYMRKERKVIQFHIYFSMNDEKRTMFNNLVRTICYNQIKTNIMQTRIILFRNIQIYLDRIIKKHLEIFILSISSVQLPPRDRERQPVDPGRIMTSSFVCIRPLQAVGEESFIANHPL